MFYLPTSEDTRDLKILLKRDIVVCTGKQNNLNIGKIIKQGKESHCIDTLKSYEYEEYTFYFDNDRLYIGSEPIKLSYLLAGKFIKKDKMDDKVMNIIKKRDLNVVSIFITYKENKTEDFILGYLITKKNT